MPIHERTHKLLDRARRFAVTRYIWFLQYVSYTSVLFVPLSDLSYHIHFNYKPYRYNTWQFIRVYDINLLQTTCYMSCCLNYYYINAKKKKKVFSLSLLGLLDRYCQQYESMFPHLELRENWQEYVFFSVKTEERL